MPKPSPETAAAAATESPSLLRKFLAVRPVLWLLLALILLRALASWPGIADRMEKADNDDLLRMVMVRDWLAGQGWFDMQQYRLLPPEGVSIHWSRYIDAALGGIITVASWLVSMPVAEQVALVLWPTLLLCLMLLLNAQGTRRASGDIAAIGAMLCVFLWTKLAEFEFAPGRIDHHNVQILAMTVLAFALIWPLTGSNGGRRVQVLSGVAGGLAAAFSLAVGLEMLPVLLAVWAFAGLRFTFGYSGRWLWVFALTLAVAAPLMMAGQVPTAAWAIRYCDALAPPMLSLLAVGVAVSVVPVLLGGLVRAPLARIGLMLAILIAGLFLALPLLGPCLEGPYGAMSPEARAVITTRISEAQPALAVALERGASFDFVLLYIFILLPLVSVQAWFARKRLQRGEGAALLLMLLIGWLGVLASLAQIRAMTIGTPAIPFLTGFAMREIIGVGNGKAAREKVGRGSLLAIVAGVLLMAIPSQVMKPLRDLLQIGRGDAAASVANGTTGEGPIRVPGLCRDAKSLAELDRLPPSLIAMTTNLGMPVLYYTRHSATAAPYHRSGDSFWNGVDPFEEEPDMIKMLRKSDADYVILCRKQDYARSDMNFAQSVLDGARPAWLEAVDPSGKGAESQLLVLRVDKAVLAQLPRQLDPREEAP